MELLPFRRAPGRGLSSLKNFPKLFRALSQEAISIYATLCSLPFSRGTAVNVFSLRWDQLDLKRGLWTIPDPEGRVPIRDASH